MKAAQVITVLITALAGYAWAAFPGTPEEFIKTVEAGKVPDGILPAEDESKARNVRFMREARAAGQRCGKNTPCDDGLECLYSGLGRYCVPRDCMTNVIQTFVEKYSLQDWPQEVMSATGYRPDLTTMNETTTKLGWVGAATQTAQMFDGDFRTAVAESLEARQPNMTELLFNMVDQCPQAASSAGVTVMLGLQYEVAAVVPKWINSFYLAVGTGGINFNVVNTTSGISFQYNVTGGIYSDCCAGVGPDAGLDLSLVAGAFLSGTDADLAECSFLFDVDAGVGSVFGLSVGVTSSRCVPKFMVTQGFGVGVGIGFTGCGTCQISRLNF